VRKDGSIVHVDSNSSPIFKGGEVVGIQGIFRDITERKRAEEALAAEKERLAVTLRSIGDGVITTDTEGKIVLINKVAEGLTGWTQEEAVSRPLGEVFHIVGEKTGERCENPVERVLESGAIVGLAGNMVLIARDGTERIIADSGAPIRDKDNNIIGVILVFQDVTEKRKMQEELLKAERLESVGILAGGIAHDFNNILTTIVGNISLAKTKVVDVEGEIFEILTVAEKASLRARDLTRQLLTFARGGAPVKKMASIVELIKDSASFALRGSNVRCEFSIPGDLWPVEVDEGQLSQVINNMVINADQAMPQGGVVRVRAENVTISAADALPLEKGERYVKISVEDQGIGIPEEHLPKVFDPYFTTKQKGSGLGLAISFSIIRNHAGLITVESELGTGTTFDVYLPASQKRIPAKRVVEEKALVARGKVLVMDDDEAVRNTVGRMLRHVGYGVDFARDGVEAIELYRKASESGNPFDLVIMDLTVPGAMGGKQAVEELLAIDPAARVIASSGYSTDPVMSNFREHGFSAVIAKPYEIKELSETLSKVMMGE
jgi:PAS domain S-box-containing protein